MMIHFKGKEKSKEVSILKTIIPMHKKSITLYLKILAFLLLLLARVVAPPEITDIPFVVLIYQILFIYLILNISFTYMRMLFANIYRRKNDYPANHYDNFIIGIIRVTFFLYHFLFLMSLLLLFGVNIRETIMSMSIFAVAMVLLFREYLTNFMNGIGIMFSKDIRYNDYIKVGEHKGRIKDIKFSNIELHTESGDIVYIPNTMVASKEVTNFSKKNAKQFSYDFVLNHSHLNKLDKLKDSIKKRIKEEYDKIVVDENVDFLLEKIDKDTITVRVEITLSKYQYKNERNMKKLIANEVSKFIVKNKKKSEEKK